MIHLKGWRSTDPLRQGTLLARTWMMLNPKREKHSVVNSSIVPRNLANPHPFHRSQGIDNTLCKPHLTLDLRSRQHLLIPQRNHLTNRAQIKEAPALSPHTCAREFLLRFRCQSIPSFQDAEGRVLSWIGKDVLTLRRGRVVCSRSGSSRRRAGG